VQHIIFRLEKVTWKFNSVLNCTACTLQQLQAAVSFDKWSTWCVVYIWMIIHCCYEWPSVTDRLIEAAGIRNLYTVVRLAK